MTWQTRFAIPIAGFTITAVASATTVSIGSIRQDDSSSTLGHDPIARHWAKYEVADERVRTEEEETAFLDVSMCFNRSVLVSAVEFYIADVAPIYEKRFYWRILHPIPSSSSAATQWFRLGDAWPVLAPGSSAESQIPGPGAYRADLQPPLRLGFADCFGWSVKGGHGPMPYDATSASKVAWATSSDGLHDAVEMFVKEGVDPITSQERKALHIAWTGIEIRTYSVRLRFDEVKEVKKTPAPAKGAPAPVVEGGNPACWRGGFNFERCCLDSEGTCWDSYFTFDRCCSLTSVKRYAEFDFSPPEVLHYDLQHLQRDNKPRLGPVQDDEALLLYALARVMRPRTIVEFGTSNGFSAMNWMHAIADDPLARVFSYDILPYPAAQALEDSDPRFVFFQKSQTDFEPSDVEGRPVDIAFFDAGHLVEYSLKAFELVRASLSPTAIVAVHDTGLHVRDFGSNAPEEEEGLSFSLDRCGKRQGGAARCHRFPGCAGDSDENGFCVGRAHRVSERTFVQEVLNRWPEFRPIHMHSRRVFRHGLTLLQKGELWSSVNPTGDF